MNAGSTLHDEPDHDAHPTLGSTARPEDCPVVCKKADEDSVRFCRLRHASAVDGSDAIRFCLQGPKAYRLTVSAALNTATAWSSARLFFKRRSGLLYQRVVLPGRVIRLCHGAFDLIDPV